MKTFARIQDGLVAELLSTDFDIATLFNSALAWVDVSNVTGIAPGWRQNADGFSPPPTPPVPTPPTLVELQTQLDTISAQIAALAKST